MSARRHATLRVGLGLVKTGQPDGGSGGCWGCSPSSSSAVHGL